MNNFCDYILNDIETKKTFLSSMPINNKTNKKKYNEKLLEIKANYVEYKESVLNYLKAKSKSFECEDKKNDLESLKKEVSDLKNIKFILNTMNTYLEKTGIDNLLYDIKNYSNFTFEKINEIISKLIDKFEMVGIKLGKDDFKYTCYVNEYMTEFFNKSDMEKLSETFEKIYWYNPNIIEHIELNFRKLIKKNEKVFNEYIKKQQQELLKKNNFNSYEEFTKELKSKYEQLQSYNNENLSKIIELARTNQIDISNYFVDSKFRTTAFDTLTIKPVDFKNNDEYKKVLDTLKKLKLNVKEYFYYLKYLPLFIYFKDKYENQDTKEKISSDLKNIESEISTRETKLDSINSKIFNDTKGNFKLFKKDKKEESSKNLKIESLKIAKELYELYVKKDKLLFEDKIRELKEDQLLLISDVVRLYYSFNLYKRETFKEVFNLSTYEEIVDMCEEFDEFASTPTNIIINGINLFEQADIASVIANKYRLENINLEPTELDEDSLVALNNKIDYVTRINKIENSNISVEKIWFMVQVDKIIEKEEKEKEKQNK